MLSNLVIQDSLKTLMGLLAASGVGNIFQTLGLSEANIIMVYILSVLIVSIKTKSRLFCLISSMSSVVVFNFLFTEPKYTLFAYDRDYFITFIIMFCSSMLTGTLAMEKDKNAKEKEEAAMLAKNEQMRANLLRTISHDLRTPLTSISGNASNLLMKSENFDEETKKQLYMDIYDDSMWLIGVVENLLAVTRLENRNVSLKLSAELVDEVIDEALHHIHKDQNNHNITTEIADEILMAKMDAKLITQVVINIVNNAIKYTQTGSEIVIRAWKEQKMIWVSVSDNGPGIPDEEKTQIFEMFYSGKKEVADSRRSMGLGLALCKTIIAAHGGELTVEDNDPTGAVFTFTLPAEEIELHE